MEKEKYSLFSKILHLLIYPRRKNRDKAEKNLEHALAILRLTMKKGKEGEIIRVFKKLHKNWKKEVTLVLKSKQADEVAEVLEGK